MVKDDKSLLEEGSASKPSKGLEKQASPGELTEYSGSEIKTKTLTWQYAAALMASEYIVIAILSFPSTFAVLGMAGGCIAALGVGVVTLYTSHILWRYCMRNPHLIDVCDIARNLFGGSTIAYELSGIAFALNNLFIMGLHCLSGSIALNTLSDGAVCTVVYTVVLAIAMFFPSLVRELRMVAVMGIVAAATMFIALLLTWIFAGTEANPSTSGEHPPIRAWAKDGTSFVHGLQACLNIVYTYVGQILIPSYISDMERPQDFPKALYAVTVFEIVLFTLGGSILYWQFGDAATSPAYGSLERTYAKIVAGFTLPTVLVVGILYSNVTSRYAFFRIFGPDSIHRQKHTVKGWAIWTVVVLAGWILAWVIGEAIPFFNNLLALMSSLFDAWFGFVFWGLAFLSLYKGALWKGWVRRFETALNYLIIACGLFIFVAGTVTSGLAIQESYDNGQVAGAFTCANNGF